MSSATSCCQATFDVLLGIGTLIAALFTVVNVATEQNWLIYFASNSSRSSNELQSIIQSHYWQDIAQYVAIAGYFFNILVLIIVTSVVVACKKAPLSCLIVMLVLFVITSICALFSNIAALVLTIVATNQFNSAAPIYMSTSLNSNCIYDTSNVSNINYDFSCGIDWHRLQLQLQCCGVNGYFDYRTAGSANWNARNPSALAPLSCCQGLNPDSYSNSTSNVIQSCVAVGNQSSYYNDSGCLSVIQAQVSTSEVVVIVFTCFVIVQILCTNFVRLGMALSKRTDSSS